MSATQVKSCDSLLRQMQAKEIAFNSERIASAWKHAEEAYEGKSHWSGISFMEHTVGVLNILLPFQPDEDAIVACLLHQLLDSKKWTLSDIEENYGEKIRELVSGVHLLSHVTLRDRRRSVEDLRLMLLTVSDDIRTVLLILCDRSYLLECLPKLSPEDQRRVAFDVLQLFAPVAARLGIYKMKYQLEAAAFPIVYPTDSERIEEQMEGMKKRYGRFLGKSAKSLKNYIEKAGIPVSIEMREKKMFSIFRKMHQKSVTHIQQLYDLFAMRVIVQTEEECYQTLGLLHKVGTPVANRFKDYIAFPKPNGYRSLHTTLVKLPGMEDESLFVEIQVRTEQMNQDAQYGIAAHWMYKEHGSTAKALQQVQLHSVLSMQQPLEGEEETNTLADHIYVLTPRGDVIELPEGATTLDFAFQLHTDLGLSFQSATVNGSIVPLDYRLENGDVVEIVKRKTPQPSPQWMQLLKMSSSRSRLKRYLNAQDRPKLVSQGREIVNIELRKHRLPLLDAGLSLLRICDGSKLTMSQREDILMKIGQGSERVSSLFTRVETLRELVPSKEPSESFQQEYSPKKKEQFEVEGEVPIPTRSAKCCKPEEWPHSLLMGVVGRKGVVVVHRKDCGMLRNANPERLLRVWWSKA